MTRYRRYFSFWLSRARASAMTPAFSRALLCVACVESKKGKKEKKNFLFFFSFAHSFVHLLDRVLCLEGRKGEQLIVGLASNFIPSRGIFNRTMGKLWIEGVEASMKSVTDPSPISSRTVNESMSRFLHRVVAKKKKKREKKSRGTSGSTTTRIGSWARERACKIYVATYTTFFFSFFFFLFLITV